jgi:hypothetical protein
MSGTEPSDDVLPGTSRRSPVRLLALVGLLAVLIGLPVVGAWVALDVVDVGRSLVAARDGLEDAQRAIGDVDLDRAQDSLAFAERHLDTARSRTTTLRWALAANAPVVGAAIDVTRDVVEGASAVTEVVTIAVTDGERLVTDGLDLALVDGVVDLTPVREAQQLTAELPVERLQAARDELAVPASGWVPGMLRDARAQTLESAEATLATVTRAQALTSALPGFLGADGPRRYFVGMQTPAELRGTGGLIAYWGVLSLDDGAIGFGQSAVYDPSDDEPTPGTATARIGQLGGGYGSGVRADPAYTARYGRRLGTSSFSNINLDPDLPTTARVALDLFALRTGERLDGMVLLDPIGLQRLLEATGPTLAVDAQVREQLGIDEELATSDFARLVTSDIYEVLGFGRDAERNEVLRQLGDAAFAQLIVGGWEGPSLARAVVDSASERHLQVFSEDGSEQAAFVDVGTAGSLPPDSGADLLAVVANNGVGGKQDVHLGHEVAVDLRLADVRRAEDGELNVARAGTVAVSVDNPLPADGVDLYVIGNCVVPGASNSCFDGPPGWNWTWFSTWLPAGTRLVDHQTAEDSRGVVGPRAYRGFDVVDHAQATRPQSRASYDLEIDGRAPLELRPDSVVYEWRWWRQAKAIPDLLDVTVYPPEGWAIDDVEVIGGGSGRGSGVHGDGVELSARVEDGAARLTGTVTADTRLRVHLADPAA